MEEIVTTDDHFDDGASFGNEISRFVTLLTSLAEVVPLMMKILSAKMIKESKELDQFIVIHDIKEGADEDGEPRLYIPEAIGNDFNKLLSTITATQIAAKHLPINYVVSFVAQYDAYLGNLIRTIFRQRPELLEACEKTIGYTDLINFGSMDEAKEYFIDHCCPKRFDCIT